MAIYGPPIINECDYGWDSAKRLRLAKAGSRPQGTRRLEALKRGGRILILSSTPGVSDVPPLAKASAWRRLC